MSVSFLEFRFILNPFQATRTPSPTLMHSPSPTPEHSYADFLDVDSNVPDLLSDDSKVVAEPPKNRDILDLFDAPNTDTTTTTIFSSSMTTEDTTNLVTGVPLISATTTQENPFVSITEQEASPTQAEDGFKSDFAETASITSEKRASIASITGVIGSDTEKAGIDLDFATESPVISETMQSSTAELFATSDHEQLPATTATSESAFFSVADTTTTSGPFGTVDAAATPFTTSMQTPSTQSFFASTEMTVATSEPSGPFASDLLGDFGGPTGDVTATSPIPGAEFPASEAYKPEEQLDNFAAATKPIESTGDAFDIFASKFDKAAEQETSGGDPFLDAFGGGPTAMDTSSDGKRILCL